MQTEIGCSYDAIVVKIMAKGIVVEFDNTQDTGFVHISKLSKDYIKNISDVVNIGDRIKVYCVKSSISECGSELSLIDIATPPVSKKPTIDDMIASADIVLKEKLARKNKRDGRQSNRMRRYHKN